MSELVTSSVVVIFVWPIVREWSAITAMIVVRVRPPFISRWIGTSLYAIVRGENWKSISTWEAWSLSRWWLIFDALTVLVLIESDLLGGPGSKAQREAILRRLLLFAPWLIVLELGFMIGAYYGRGNFEIRAEPGTLFASFNSWPAWQIPSSVDFWKARSTAPLLIVGMAYFRQVARWPWIAALSGSIMLVPAGIILSMYWSAIYTWYPFRVYFDI